METTEQLVIPEQDSARALDPALDQIQKATALEQAIREQLEPIEDDLTHHFAHGVYGRELRLPAGAVIVGKIHKFSSLNVLLKGEMLVTTDTGARHVRAGEVITAPPGTKRAGYALTDCSWLTCHGTHETDLDKIEQHFIAQNEQEFLEFCQQQHLLTEE